jgi:hypothetical protein
MLVYEKRETAVFYILSLRVYVAVRLSNRARNETPRRGITVTSSFNEISTDQQRNKVGEGGRYSAHPALLNRYLKTM